MPRIEPANRRISYFNSKPYIFVKKIIQRFLYNWDIAIYPAYDAIHGTLNTSGQVSEVYQILNRRWGCHQQVKCSSKNISAISLAININL